VRVACTGLFNVVSQHFEEGTDNGIRRTALKEQEEGKERDK
jgi:hypothetical protein